MKDSLGIGGQILAYKVYTILMIPLYLGILNMFLNCIFGSSQLGKEKPK